MKHIELITNNLIQNRFIKETINLKNHTDDEISFKKLFLDRCFETLLEIKSPIEKIMFGVLLNCHTKYGFSEFFPENIYPFKPNLIIYPQYKINNYIVDFCVTIEKTDNNFNQIISDKYIIECDGHDFHEKTKLQAKHDKQRDRFFTSNDFKVLRYTGSEIFNDYLKIQKELMQIFNNNLMEDCNE